MTEYEQAMAEVNARIDAKIERARDVIDIMSDALLKIAHHSTDMRSAAIAIAAMEQVRLRHR